VAISTGAAFLGSLRVLKIGPREALTSHYHGQDFTKKPLVERLLERKSGGGRVLTRIPVRNLGRQRLRTGMSMVALAVSLVLVFSCTAMVFGFAQPLRRNYDEYEKWDVKATFVGMEMEGDVEAGLEGVAPLGIYGEPMLDTFMPMERKGELQFVQVQAFQESSRLRDFNVIDGKEDLDRGVLVGTILAKDLDLEPGDKVSFAVGNSTVEVKVVGITGELMDSSFLMTLERAGELFGTGGMVNAIIVDMGHNSRADVESSLREHFAIAGFAYTDDVVDGMGAMLEDMEAMLFLFIFFGIGAEMLFVSTTLVLNILDRENEFVSLRAMGLPPGRIRGMIATESMVLLLGSLIIGLPLGYYVTQAGMEYMVGDLMYFQLDIDPMAYVLATSIAVLSALLAALMSSRYILKINLPDAMRQRE
jgi:putative ABC transport system permease protein